MKSQPKVLLKILQKEISKLNNKKLGILLSGGIDSTILAYLLKENNKNFIAVTIAKEFRHSDIMASLKITKAHNIEHIIYLPDEETIKQAKKECKLKYNGDEAVFLGLRMLSKFTKNIIATDGIDELMGGYWEHEANADNENNLKLVFEKHLDMLEEKHLRPMRESATKVGVDIDWIYLHDSIVKYISNIPYSLRIAKNNRKMFWKEVGRLVGIPEWVIERKKIGFCDAFR